MYIIIQNKSEVISILDKYPNILPDSDQLKVLNHYNHSALIFYKSQKYYIFRN